MIRCGILSCAHYHATFWAEAITASADATLVGVWDDDPARGAQAAARFGVRFWPDLAALLRECDAVGITAETVKHAPLVEAAAAAGAHILCEKPMATTQADCDRIARAVRRSGVTFMQNFPKRFDPINHELVDLARGGEIGDVRLVRVRHGHAHGLDPAFRAGWFVDPALSGGGTLIDEGIHAADFLRWLLGEPVDVRATIAHGLGLPVEDTAVAAFTFPGGVAAEVTTSWVMAGAEQSVEVYGTAGSALLSGVDLASRDLAAPPYLRVLRRDGGRRAWAGSATVPRFVAGGFHQEGPRQFLACLRTGEMPPVGLDDGRASVEMILAAYRAAATGRAEVFRDAEVTA